MFRFPAWWLPAGLPLLVLLASSVAQDQADQTKKFKKFSPSDFIAISESWSPEKGAEGTWREGKDNDGDPKFLVCSGKPTGFLRTRQVYDNFRLSFEWRYAKDESGNSGVLLYTKNAKKIWPQSLQVQLHVPKAGSVLTHDGAKKEGMLAASGLVTKPLLWNRCVIISRDGTLTVEINGKKVGTVTNCVPKAGHIALQSEGSVVHFRNIELVPAPKPPSDSGAATAAR